MATALPQTTDGVAASGLLVANSPWSPLQLQGGLYHITASATGTTPTLTIAKLDPNGVYDSITGFVAQAIPAAGISQTVNLGPGTYQIALGGTTTVLAVEIIRVRPQ